MQIGIDFGGTKIEAAALDEAGNYLLRIRQPNPGSYDGAISTVCGLVENIEQTTGQIGTIGIGTPGSISPKTGLMRNSNSLYLNGRNFRGDLSETMNRDIRIANDANCFTLSEAFDGSGAGAQVCFGIILGTGCGGGVVLNGQLINGKNGIAGEWGHNPLPWARADEVIEEDCYCGKRGCLEQWISGTGFQRDYFKKSGKKLESEEIISLARQGEKVASQALEDLIDRIGRAIATVCNTIDPNAIVIGGGLSNVPEIFEGLQSRVEKYVFSDVWSATIAPAKWGDSSGVRGAARLWPIEN